MRPVDSVIAAASIMPIVRRLYFQRIHFDGGVVAWHSGFGNIVLDGYTYKGLGTLGNISAIKETPGIKSTSISIKISGIKPEIVSLAQSELFINRKAYTHMTILDDQDRPLTATPVLLFKGCLDGINGKIGKEASFDVAIKSRLADWERPRKLRYTDADQQKIHNGDRFFEYVPQLSQRKLIWPRAAFLPDPRD